MASAWARGRTSPSRLSWAARVAAIAAVAAFVLFRERLGRLQIAGVAIIAIGVTVLAFLQADPERG